MVSHGLGSAIPSMVHPSLETLHFWSTVGSPVVVLEAVCGISELVLNTSPEILAMMAVPEPLQSEPGVEKSVGEGCLVFSSSLSRLWGFSWAAGPSFP